MDLNHTAPEIKNNDNIVLAAVEQNGCAIRFAGEKMKNNEKIKIKKKSISNNPLALVGC